MQLHSDFYRSVGRASDRHAADAGKLSTQVRFPGAARDFSPRVSFQCRLSYGVRTPPCAIACIYTCAHVKYPVIYVRVRWIMETLKHPECTVGWVARLCRSSLSPGKTIRISHRRNPIGKISLIILIYPLTTRVFGAPQMISPPVSSIFPTSPLPSRTWLTPVLSIP